MGGNVLQVLTKVSPCRQIQAPVAYYIPLCVWSVTKSWVIAGVTRCGERDGTVQH